jgi:UDP-N-acetylmuramoyl-tripeptide--D-alanyl-D-alanine ligase
VERLYAIGGLAKLAVDSFGAGGQWFADAQALSSALARDLGGHPSAAAAGVRLLIKGSRVNRLERVVDMLARGSADRAVSEGIPSGDGLVQGSTQQTGGH